MPAVLRFEKAPLLPYTNKRFCLLSRSSAIGLGKAETMRAKQSKENERAFSRPSFLLFDSEWFFNRSRRSYYMNSYYLFLLLVWVFTFSGELKGKVSTFSGKPSQ